MQKEDDQPSKDDSAKSTQQTNVQILDWSAVFRAAQEISSEVDERKILRQLLLIVVSNVSAQRGFIVIDDSGTYRIEVESGQGLSGPNLGDSIRPDTPIAQTVIRYSAATGDCVVIDEAANDDRFSSDPYIQRDQPLSILCAPIKHLGNIIGFLYLENNLVRSAFTPERSEVVNMLAAQAVISIANARLYENMKQEIAERKFIEQRLRKVAEATSPVTGSDYFGKLVQYLADAFEVRYAFISRCTDERNTHVRTLAFWSGDDFGDNFEYALSGTPCEKVICGEAVQHTEHLQVLFPTDLDLAKINAHSYLGVPLFDSDGRVIGHLAILDDKPMPERRSDRSIFNIFATRAGSEVERNRAAESLQQAHDQLEMRVEERTDALSQANRRLQNEIQERALIEESLHDAKEAAEASNLAKSRFLANMSHELRTPLNAILGYAQILMRDRSLTSDQSASVTTIERSGDHLLALIDDVLSLAKIEAGKFGIAAVEFRLLPFLQSTLDITRVRAEQKGIEFRYEVSEELPLAVRADERAVRQVLLNLIGNAIKFTDQGCVTFSVTYQPPNDHAGCLHFAVRDTGIGIPAQCLEEIFEPFQQLTHRDRRDEGTGLGLAISQNLAHLMGSRIVVDSTPGVGSVFSFELPIVTPAETGMVDTDIRNPSTVKLAPGPLLRCPEIHDLEALQQLATAGDIHGVLEKLKKIVTGNSDFLPFVAEIKRMAANFQMRQVIVFLDRYIDESSRSSKADDQDQ